MSADAGPATGPAIHLIRHAQALPREDWGRDDDLRPLSGLGSAQAEALAKRLSCAGPGVLLSSPALRCRATLEPLAQLTGLDVEVAPFLAEGAPPPRALAALLERAVDAAPVVACSHGDVVGGLVEWLLPLGVVFRSPLGFPKAGTWELTVAGDRISEALLVPPPSV